MATYRPIEDDEDDAYRALTKYAFSPVSGPYDPDAERDERRERMWAFGDRRGMFDGDRLVACCNHIPFEARVRGTWLSMAGLSAVATPPEHRRRGHVAAMLEATLREYDERDWPIAALYPFKESFYARFGWATACRSYRATIAIDALDRVFAVPDGAFHRTTPDAWEALEPAYDAWLEGTTLATRRTAAWWRNRVFQGIESMHYATRWERDGAARGYLIYRIDDEEERRLVSAEVASVDLEALCHLLYYCYQHDSQVDKVVLTGPDLDRLIDVVDERDALEVVERPGAMVRVVNVQRCLAQLPVPPGAGGSFVVELADEYAPWNDGRFAVEAVNGRFRVEPTEAAPDVRAGIGAFSQLVVGYLPPRRLGEVAEISVEREDVWATLEGLFPPVPTYLPESF